MDTFQFNDFFVFLVEVVLISGIASLVLIYYTRKQTKLSDDEFKNKLFKKYNSEYGKLNNSLHQIEALEDNDPTFNLEKLKKDHSELYEALNDYVNLCAEEKYWHKMNRIDERVWNAWRYGMQYWYNNLRTLKEHWEIEYETNKVSYYLNGNEDLFERKESKTADVNESQLNNENEGSVVRNKTRA